MCTNANACIHDWYCCYQLASLDVCNLLPTMWPKPCKWITDQLPMPFVLCVHVFAPRLLVVNGVTWHNMYYAIQKLMTKTL